jgi:DMSO reductase anchor subunit
VAAFLVQLAGLMAERWYFFIEAEHPQNVYYQVIS